MARSRRFELTALPEGTSNGYFESEKGAWRSVDIACTWLGMGGSDGGSFGRDTAEATRAVPGTLEVPITHCLSISCSAPKDCWIPFPLRLMLTGLRA
jgi:hypothetical protein